jgi:hypothetical protein
MKIPAVDGCDSRGPTGAGTIFRIYRISRKGDRLLLAKTACPRTARQMLDAHDNPWTALVVQGPNGEISTSVLEQLEGIAG